jgi:hypothetical protein
MRRADANRIDVCHNRPPTARKSLILNGEMSEWLSAYAAKPLRRDISPELATNATRAEADEGARSEIDSARAC